ncbi:hypothetical protein [Haloarcula nitratireducens]|uniref:Uncharacterized protein n=1 Tax=Haloarcula nitratireducens TaxID=2487749 RepID=A0AAW4P6J1_9EURY|nr:hypothetical protein [Halomicroarcula nitratireducens]MBX0293476.1 hypothetical protein [Halomicroarcula nitratireducens]
MTDDEQVRAALAALAGGEGETAAESDAGDRRSLVRATSEREAGANDGDESEDYRAVIERAATATKDVEAAAQFVEDVGLAALESAVERAEREVSELATEGRAALAAFERFRSVADGRSEER